MATAAMGTRFEFVLFGDDEAHLLAAGEDAVEAIEDAHRRLSRFEPGGPIYEVNAAAGRSTVRVDDEILDLLQRCEDVREATGGAFTIARPRDRQISGEENCHTARLHIDRDAGAVGLYSDHSMIDLGGVAKGFALDLAAQRIREASIESAFLHGGSSTIVAIGSPGDRDAWQVLLDTPSQDGESNAVLLRDMALSVSSQCGDRPGHVIDPATGQAASGTHWAACIGASAEATDAWSTAMVVLGDRPNDMPRQLTSVMKAELSAGLSSFIAKGDSESCIVTAHKMTPALAARPAAHGE